MVTSSNKLQSNELCYEDSYLPSSTSSNSHSIKICSFSDATKLIDAPNGLGEFVKIVLGKYGSFSSREIRDLIDASLVQDEVYSGISAICKELHEESYDKVLVNTALEKMLSALDTCISIQKEPFSIYSMQFEEIILELIKFERDLHIRSVTNDIDIKKQCLKYMPISIVYSTVLLFILQKQYSMIPEKKSDLTDNLTRLILCFKPYMNEYLPYTEPIHVPLKPNNETQFSHMMFQDHISGAKKQLKETDIGEKMSFCLTIWEELLEEIK